MIRTQLVNGEQVVISGQKHWFLIASSAILPLFFWLLAAGTNVGGLYLVAALFSAVLVYRIVDWRTHQLVLTTTRVIHEHGVFSHNSKECPLEKLNNVSYRQSLFGRVFGYGDLLLQTAAEMGATKVRFMSRPRILKDAIVKCQDDVKQLQVASQARALADAIHAKHGVGTKPCPFCGEEIKTAATLCRFCNRELPGKVA